MTTTRRATSNTEGNGATTGYEAELWQIEEQENDDGIVHSLPRRINSPNWLKKFARTLKPGGSIKWDSMNSERWIRI
jgi:hypothetical protein